MVTTTSKLKKKGPTHHPLIAPDDGHVVSQSYVLSADSHRLIEAMSTVSLPAIPPVLPQANDLSNVPNNDTNMEDSPPLIEEDENVEVPPRHAKRYTNSDEPLKTWIPL
ncbi:hypothetical protein JAAARDRAFT_197845 [Jaapia argillacea MUCL 33604]|uniref:Uncharacterized protein n=1 Tax=Jaapia argillacea MUCL 33604 TaxID=933084 RepID=A0A067PP42_9AGAM|nr:hypothetical protein JAAARDRAFT_197845 [Jaapia argillacea MUCL 33604]